MKNKNSCYQGFLSFPISCLLLVRFINKQLDPSSLSALMSSNIIYWIYYSMIPLQQKKTPIDTGSPTRSRAYHDYKIGVRAIGRDLNRRAV